MTNLEIKKIVQKVVAVMLALPMCHLVLTTIRNLVIKPLAAASPLDIAPGAIHQFADAYVFLGPAWLYSGYAEAISVLVSFLAGTLIYQDYYSGGAVSEEIALRLAAIFPKSKSRGEREDQDERSDI